MASFRRDLVIVLAVVASITAVVAPPLNANRSRERLSNRDCESNLRELARAFSAYAADNNGDYPPYNTNAMLARPGARFYPRSTVRLKLHYFPAHPDLLVASLLPYTKTTLVWHCPEDPYAPGQSACPTPLNPFFAVDHHFSSYVESPEFGLAGEPDTPQGIDFLDQSGKPLHLGGPQSVLLSEEMIQIAVPRPWWRSLFFPTEPAPTTYAYSHDGHFNVLMYDGHVVSRKVL